MPMNKQPTLQQHPCYEEQLWINIYAAAIAAGKGSNAALEAAEEAVEAHRIRWPNIPSTGPR